MYSAGVGRAEGGRGAPAQDEGRPAADFLSSDFDLQKSADLLRRVRRLKSLEMETAGTR